MMILISINGCMSVSDRSVGLKTKACDVVASSVESFHAWRLARGTSAGRLNDQRCGQIQ
jgi:hypothetical protein